MTCLAVHDAHVHPTPTGSSPAEPRFLFHTDPLDPDLADDPLIVLSHRQIGRLIFIAAETGARFERESIPYDPVAWLFSSRRLFDGLAAVDACRQVTGFTRAIILHGLSLGLDADPDHIDSLLADDHPQDRLTRLPELAAL